MWCGDILRWEVGWLNAPSCVSYSIVILCSELLLHTIEEVREEIQEVTVLLASLWLKRLTRTAAAAAAAASLDWMEFTH